MGSACNDSRPLNANARRYWWVAVAVLLTILAIELIVPAHEQSQTPDEANHLLAGVQYWKYGDFGVNPEHPPLAKLVAALPALGVPSPAPAPFTQFFKMENFGSAIPFLYTHNADAMLWRSRAAISAFTFALALLVLAAGCEMFDPMTGLAALLVFVFEPNLLAHGAMITTDMAAACCMFAAVFAFYRWQKHPTAGRVIVCGIALGLALAAKHSGIFLLPVLLALALMEFFSQRKDVSRFGQGRKALRLAIALIAIGVMGWTILWASYEFRYQARPGSLAMIPSLADYTASPHSPLAEAVIPRLAAWHVVPEAYLFGIVDILVAAKRDPMFLLGTDYATGHWFYFPVALLIKSTLGFLALLVFAPFLKNLWRDGKWRAMAYLAIPSLLYLGASMASTMDIGIRHILPVFPFFVLIAAAAAVALARKQPWGKYVAGGLMLAHVASSVLVFPFYLTYANEAWGGPTNTYRLLTDSNADWNQGLRAAKSYLDDHNIRDCWFAHYGWDVDPAYYNIPCKPLPDSLSHYFGQPLPQIPAQLEGTVLVSATEADGDYWGPGDLNPYAQFLHRRPDALIANSILVFHGKFDVSQLSALTHLSQAQQFAGQQQWDKALAEVQVALEMEPGLAEAHAVQGQILLGMHRTGDAQRSFQEALALAHADYPEFQVSRILKIPAQFSAP